MKKQLKKTLSFILSLMLIMSMFAGLDIISFAEDDILSYLEYEINNGEVTITWCDDSISGDVVIPDTIEGYPTTIIGDYAFSSRRNIESITLPEGLISICNKAFFECDNLTEIEIPDSVELIGEFALGYYLKKDFVNGKIVDVNAVKKDFVINDFCIPRGANVVQPKRKNLLELLLRGFFVPRAGTYPSKNGKVKVVKMIAAL